MSTPSARRSSFAAGTRPFSSASQAEGRGFEARRPLGTKWLQLARGSRLAGFAPACSQPSNDDDDRGCRRSGDEQSAQADRQQQCSRGTGHASERDLAEAT
jgi:hypothetical protein